MSDRLFVLSQYILPKQALTALAGKLANIRGGGVTTSFIQWFAGKYGVNMAEAANPDFAAYPTFNEFFTRPLKAGARPMAQTALVSPVDGAVSQLGAIKRTRFFRPRATVIPPRRWWGAMLTWLLNLRTVVLPRFT